MSFFGSKGPTPHEEKKARIVKSTLVENLGHALQLMQMNHVQSEEPIYSGDSANAVCNVLEAIFLHEMKDNSFNFSSYFATPAEKLREINFWPFLKKFTHKGVIVQLENLSQIDTDIGRCRSWIRLAMNDGLIESYVDAMIADKKTLRTHYRSMSFLRDTERPDILKTYLQGLNQFTFQLSHNSSILNIWTHTPLLLAGLVISNEVPNAIVTKPTHDSSITKRKISDARIVDLGEATSKKSGNNSSEIRVTSAQDRSHNLDNNDSKSIGAEFLGVPEIQISSSKMSDSVNVPDNSHTTTSDDFITPPNTPNEVPVLLSQSLDELNVDDAFYEHRPSFVQSSPTITPPNTPYATVYLTKEALLKNSDISSAEAAGDEKDNEASCETLEIDSLPDQITDIESSCDSENTSQENKSPDLCKTGQWNSPLANRRADSLTADSLLSSGSDYQTATSNSSQPMTPTNTPFDASLLKDAKTTDELKSLSEKLERNIQQQLKNNDDSESAAENKDSLPELEVAHDACLDFSTSPTAENTEKASLDSTSFPTHDRRRSDPVPPQLSSAIAWATKDESYITRAVEKLRDSANTLSQNIFGENSEDDDEKDDSGSFKGNKLGFDDMMGWSSAPMETSSTSLTLETDNQLTKTDSLEQTVSLTESQERALGESYGSLLKNYATPAITVPAPTITSVIENLEANSPGGSAKSHPKHKSNQPISDNNNPADFEVIPFSASITSQNAEPSIQAFMSVLGEICNEKGLDVQNYQCRGCSKPIGMIYGSYRVCRYDGFYYCTDCHKNDEYYIPSRIVHNWDFRKFKVSKDSKCFLLQIQEEPMLNIEEINPKLYSHVEEMDELKRLREQLMSLKAYLFTCQQTVADELRKRVWPKEYLYDNPHLYSLCDLLQVHSGGLAILLKKIIRFASKHVYECRLCSQKGFFCEICDIPKVIYPFEFETTTKCSKCKSVFHSNCKDDLKPCPKCERWQLRQLNLSGNNIITTPDITDFAFRPNFNGESSENS